VVGLEQECGLNSRGIDGYQKIISDPRYILLMAMNGDDRSSTFGAFGTFGIVGVFSGIVILDELQIDNLAVATGERRKGIGESLLNSALTIAARLGARTAILEVRSANSTARSFYEKIGFEKVGQRKAYYTAPPDDAIILSCEIQKPIINVS